MHGGEVAMQLPQKLFHSGGNVDKMQNCLFVRNASLLSVLHRKEARDTLVMKTKQPYSFTNRRLVFKPCLFKTCIKYKPDCRAAMLTG